MSARRVCSTPVRLAWAGLFVSLAIANASQPISDELLSLATLRGIFRGMQVSVDSHKRIDDSWPEKPRAAELSYPDSLADEAVYRVVGKPLNKIESCASEDIVTERPSNIREVRMKLFNWPKAGPAGLLAVLQYSF